MPMQLLLVAGEEIARVREHIAATQFAESQRHISVCEAAIV